MRVLIISGLPLDWSSNLGYNIAKDLKERGYDVDFLTKDEVDNAEPWMYFVYNRNKIKEINSARIPELKIKNHRSSNYNTYIGKFKSQIRRLLIKFKKKIELLPTYADGEEINNQVSIEDLIRSLPNKKYDRVSILFWWGMISVESLKVIQDKYRCETIVYGIDMSAMTGGCHYFGDCRRFRNECRGCPATRFTRSYNLPHSNYLLKKEVYSNPNFKFTGNTWMLRYFEESGLFKPSQLIKSSIFIDANIFKPVDMAEKRKSLGLPVDKFIFFCGASYPEDTRKGFHVLKEAFSLFIEDKYMASNCLLLVAGKGKMPDFGIETKCLGLLSMTDLADIYAVSDVYLSPSIDDAGPSMVNQALMCGTPVVAFDMGTAVDCVITGTTGYKAKYRDPKDFCEGMRFLYNFTEKSMMRKSCRDLSLQWFKTDIPESNI